jgi:hypothetical protein
MKLISVIENLTLESRIHITTESVRLFLAFKDRRKKSFNFTPNEDSRVLCDVM